MLLDNLRSKSKTLIKLWLVILSLQIGFFIVNVIIAAAMSPSNGTWIWNFLTLTRGLDSAYGTNTITLAIIWLVINGTLTAIDFLFSYAIHKENSKVSKKSHSDKDMIILAKMHRNLKFVMILVLLALFMQVLSGVLWWIIGIFAVVFKYFYYRELSHLYVNDPIFNLKKE